MAISRAEAIKYNNIVKTLADLKEAEMSLRKMLVARIVDDESAVVNKSGKYVINGDRFTGTAKLTENASFDQDEVELAYENLSAAEQECFKKKWSLVAGKFNSLEKLYEISEDGQYSDVIDLVTKKPGAPALEFKIES